MADVPSLEAAPDAEAAASCGVLPVLIATPSDSPEHQRQIAHLCRGYTYVVTRAGVTGTDDTAQLDHSELLQTLFFWHTGLSLQEALLLAGALSLLFWLGMAVRLFRRESEAVRWLVGVALVLLLVIVRVSGRSVTLWAWCSVLALIVITQGAWLIPELASRTDIILSGGEPPPSYAHAIYSTLELAKIGILAFVGIRSLAQAT